MKPLNILIYSGDNSFLQGMVQKFNDDGAHVRISARLIGELYFSGLEWDFLLVDLDELNSFMRNILSIVPLEFPDLPVVGISTKSGAGLTALDQRYNLKLDAYFLELPQVEELIDRFPQVTTKKHAAQVGL